MAFFLFQFAFADTCSTITSGAMVGRTGFKGDLLYSSASAASSTRSSATGSGVRAAGCRPSATACSSVTSPARPSVHTMGGMIALAGAIVLGPRLGRKFKRDGGGLPPGHDLTVAAIGGVILWFGWYGFNPGSTLSAIDAAGIGRVATNTTLAAAAGGLAAMVFVYPRVKKWDMGITINGFLGGLVAITAPCYWVNSVRVGDHRLDRRHHRRARHRPHRAPPDRRSDRAVAVHGIRRHLGHVGRRPVRHRPVRRRGPVLGRRRRTAVAQIWGNALVGDRRLRRRPSPSCTASSNARHPASLRGGRARRHRHPRARFTGLPPGSRLHGKGV